MQYHLAQVNVGEILGPTDDPIMAEFMAALDKINAIADQSPGFVWRLQSDDGNATDYRPYENPNIMLNLSVWESVDALHAYVYKTVHLEYVKRRKEWFQRFGQPHMCLWWIPAGHIPPIEEAITKLNHLTEHGPTPESFTFAKRFPCDVKAVS
ncbi:MAG: DUF3291 domain-containing protein [Chloroflexota bacterium]